MRKTLVTAARATALMAASGVAALGAAGQDIKLHTAAYGNFPESEVIDHSYVGAQWAAANYMTSAHATARGHPFDPPFTATVANSMFDQSQAHDAVLRADGLARQPYRGAGDSPNRAEVTFKMEYSLHIENLAASPLKIVLGNDLHGRFAAMAGGVVYMEENTQFFGPGTGGIGFASMLLTSNGLTPFADWENTTTPMKFQDPVFGEIDGYEMHSYQYLGEVTLAGGDAIDVDVKFELEMMAQVSEHVNAGVAWFDFSNTGYLNTKAFDPISGEDRSSEIRVSVVTTPAPGGAGVAMVLGGWAIRRRRRA